MRKFILVSVLLAVFSMAAKSQYSSGIFIEKLLQTDKLLSDRKLLIPNLLIRKLQCRKLQSIRANQPDGTNIRFRYLLMY